MKYSSVILSTAQTEPTRPIHYSRIISTAVQQSAQSYLLRITESITWCSRNRLQRRFIVIIESRSFADNFTSATANVMLIATAHCSLLGILHQRPQCHQMPRAAAAAARQAGLVVNAARIGL